jgi:lipid A disaccharide synthetase
MDKEVVKELIQQEMNEENLVHELGLLLTNKNKQQKLQEDYIIINDTSLENLYNKINEIMMNINNT